MKNQGKPPEPITFEDLKWAAQESIQRLDARRRELDLSINEVARRAGLDVSRVWRIFASTTHTAATKGRLAGGNGWRMMAITRDQLEIALGFDIGESVPRLDEIRNRQRASQ